MRLSIAAGILVVSLPSDIGADRAALKHQLLEREAFGDKNRNRPPPLATIAKPARRGRTWKNRSHSKFRPFFKVDDAVLTNRKHKEAEKECKPASYGGDVGILACGLGQYCQESPRSGLGGFCTSSAPMDLNRRLPEYGNYEHYQVAYVCSIPGCDCSELQDSIGPINCGPVYKCYSTCDPSLCVAYSMFFDVLDVTNFTFSATYCFAYSAPTYYQKVCYNYYYSYPGSGNCYCDAVDVFFDDVKCNSVNATYLYDGEYQQCIAFDCTNTNRNIAGDTCAGDHLRPERFYENCTTDMYLEYFRCNPCGALGSYISIPDGVVGTYSCQQIEVAGQNSLISPNECAVVTPLVAANCECVAAPTPTNDLCSGALPLVINSGEVLLGTIKGATPNQVEECVGNSTTGEIDSFQGVWYKLLGNGMNTTIDLCLEETNFDTVVKVFEGSCTNLVCIGGNDDSDACILSSAFSWFAEADKTYYIFVHGFDGAVGEFSITSPLPDDSSSSASPTLSEATTPPTMTPSSTPSMSPSDGTSIASLSIALLLGGLVTISSLSMVFLQ